MKEKALMTAFFAGHLYDSAVSYSTLILKGWKEIGFLGESPYMSQLDKILIIKMGVIAVMIGAYALSSALNMKRTKFVTERVLLAGTIMVWGVQAWNAFNVIGEIALRGR